jgi:hypothetical protein
LNPREKERVRKDSRSKEKTFEGKAKGALYLRGKKTIFLEGTQAMPTRPSDKDRMRVKTLG